MLKKMLQDVYIEFESPSPSAIIITCIMFSVLFVQVRKMKRLEKKFKPQNVCMIVEWLGIQVYVQYVSLSSFKYHYVDIFVFMWW